MTLPRWSKRALVLSGVLLALAAASALGYAYFLSRVDWRWPTERFDVQKWKTSPKEARYVYCKDLKQSGILMNSTAAEVRALLGEPDYRSADGSYVTYIIKHRDASDIGMTAIYLLQLDFSATGRVQRAFLRAD